MSPRPIIAAALAATATALLAACGGASPEPTPQPTVSVATNPTALSMRTGTSTRLQAQAAVTNLPAGAGTAVYVSMDWALQEADGGLLASPAAQGETFTITYTAPDRPGVYHVRATDHADSSIGSVVTITVD